jgi:nucleoside-diphosphate-sugar epimerase
MRLLVAGGTGFIGRNLLEYLVPRFPGTVFATHFHNPPIVIEGVEWIQADLTNKADVDRALQGKDSLVQAAAVTSGAKDIVERPFIHVTANAIMNSLLMEQAARLHFKRVIFLSCAVMYQSSSVAQTEDNWDRSLPPFPAYEGVARMKVFVEDLCRFYSNMSDTSFTAIRHTNCYGPYDKFDLNKGHVLAATIRKVLDAEPKSLIEMWGTGKEKRDFLYVTDLCELVECILTTDVVENFELYNAGSGVQVSIGELCEKIQRVSEASHRFVFDSSKPFLPVSISLDSSKARDLYGWAPKVDLNAGLEATVSFYRKTRI